ncbi:hypothetical protein V1512DRAFT_262459 [Lipomyces arxii]|uniref:uncharacterized protein n=1 Tax=Lipomyces arxii TaxID=56418 RepID=UPI0034CFF766
MSFKKFAFFFRSLFTRKSTKAAKKSRAQRDTKSKSFSGNFFQHIFRIKKRPKPTQVVFRANTRQPVQHSATNRFGQSLRRTFGCKRVSAMPEVEPLIDPELIAEPTSVAQSDFVQSTEGKILAIESAIWARSDTDMPPMTLAKLYNPCDTEFGLCDTYDEELSPTACVKTVQTGKVRDLIHTVTERQLVPAIVPRVEDICSDGIYPVCIFADDSTVSVAIDSGPSVPVYTTPACASVNPPSVTEQSTTAVPLHISTAASFFAESLNFDDYDSQNDESNDDNSAVVEQPYYADKSTVSLATIASMFAPPESATSLRACILEQKQLMNDDNVFPRVIYSDEESTIDYSSQIDLSAMSLATFFVTAELFCAGSEKSSSEIEHCPVNEAEFSYYPDLNGVDPLANPGGEVLEYEAVASSVDDWQDSVNETEFSSCPTSNGVDPLANSGDEILKNGVLITETDFSSCLDSSEVDSIAIANNVLEYEVSVNEIKFSSRPTSNGVGPLAINDEIPNCEAATSNADECQDPVNGTKFPSCPTSNRVDPLTTGGEVLDVHVYKDVVPAPDPSLTIGFITYDEIELLFEAPYDFTKCSESILNFDLHTETERSANTSVTGSRITGLLNTFGRGTKGFKFGRR